MWQELADVQLAMSANQITIPRASGRTSWRTRLLQRDGLLYREQGYRRWARLRHSSNT